MGWGGGRRRRFSDLQVMNVRKEKKKEAIYIFRVEERHVLTNVREPHSSAQTPIFCRRFSCAGGVTGALEPVTAVLG